MTLTEIGIMWLAGGVVIAVLWARGVPRDEVPDYPPNGDCFPISAPHSLGARNPGGDTAHPAVAGDISAPFHASENDHG